MTPQKVLQQAVDDRVDVHTIVIHAQHVTVGEKPAELPTKVVQRYQWNAMLFAVLVALCGFWFYRHAKTYISQAVVIGLPALWAAWQLFSAWIAKDLGKGFEKTRQKILAREGTTENLIILCVFAAICLLTTASVVATLGTGAPQRTVIAVTDTAGHPIMNDLVLDASHRARGKLFIPRGAFAKIKVVLKEPPGYVPVDAKPLALNPWTAVEIDFTKFFKRKEFHALRIVPSHELHHALLNANDGVLTISAAGRPPIVISKYRYQTVCTGVEASRELSAVYARNNNAEYIEWLKQELMDQQLTADRAAELANSLRRARFYPTRDYKPGEVITVTLTASGIKPVRESIVIEKGEMTTRLLRATVLEIEEEEDP
jgi:hypothetical protein